MTWWRYPITTYNTEAKPLDAAVERRIVRGNLLHLAGQTPAVGTPWIANGTKSTGSLAFDDASTVWRSQVRMVRSCVGSPIRSISVRAELYMSAGTATVRLCASNRWRMPADPPQDDVQEIESAAGAVTSVSAATPTELTLTLPSLLYTGQSAFGAGGDQRGVQLYDTVFLVLQAKVNANPNLCYFRNAALVEVPPA